MKNKEIKRLLNSAAQKTAPDVLDSVLSGCEQQKGRNFVMTNATTSESPRRRPSEMPMPRSKSRSRRVCGRLSSSKY